MTEPLRIDGLKQFTKNLKTLDSELPKAVRVALNASADAVIDRARPRIPSRRGRARKSVKAKSTRTLARVAGGSRQAPYYPWLDFGGRVGPKRSVSRPFKKQGRYLYKSYGELRDSGEFEEILSEALADVARSAGIELDN